MNLRWLILAVVLEILSCAGYILAFLQVFERSPIRFGARVALTELAFNSAVSLGGVGSVAVGGLLLVERGGDPTTVAERSAVLFLLTTAINVLTLILVGFLLWLGVLPGNQNPWLSLFPALFCTVAFLAVLAIPRYSERLAARRPPGKLRTLLEETAISIRLTERVLFRWDWRIIGAIAYLWCDIAVLMACFAAAGPVPPLAVVVLAYQIGYLSNVIPGAGRDRRAGRQPGRHVRALRGDGRVAGDGRDGRLSRDLAVGTGAVGHGRVPDPAAHARPADQPASAARRTPPAATSPAVGRRPDWSHRVGRRQLTDRATRARAPGASR